MDKRRRRRMSCIRDLQDHGCGALPRWPTSWSPGSCVQTLEEGVLRSTWYVVWQGPPQYTHTACTIHREGCSTLRGECESNTWLAGSMTLVTSRHSEDSRSRECGTPLVGMSTVESVNSESTPTCQAVEYATVLLESVHAHPRAAYTPTPTHQSHAMLCRVEV